MWRRRNTGALTEAVRQSPVASVRSRGSYGRCDELWVRSTCSGCVSVAGAGAAGAQDEQDPHAGPDAGFAHAKARRITTYAAPTAARVTRESCRISGTADLYDTPTASRLWCTSRAATYATVDM